MFTSVQAANYVRNRILEYNNDDPTKRKKCECEFDECISVLGGDLMQIATNLGYTAQKDFIFVRTASVNCLIYRKVKLTPSFHFQNMSSLRPIHTNLK